MRHLSPYEQTHLARFDKAGIDINKYGEMPVEYITGKVEFLSQVFKVTQDTLIPRSETEQLVELAFDYCPKTKNVIRVGDIGTGCGAIGISLALKLIKSNQPAELWLTEVSEEALAVAKENLIELLPAAKLVEQSKSVTTYQLTKQQITFHLVQSDLLNEVDANLRFDLFIANLPYIPHSRLPSLESSVTDFEPTLALDGGDDGLTLIRKFVQQAEKMLKVDGKILLEVDYTHTADDFQKFTNKKIKTIEDLFLRQRFVVLL